VSGVADVTLAGYSPLFFGKVPRANQHRIEQGETLEIRAISLNSFSMGWGPVREQADENLFLLTFRFQSRGSHGVAQFGRRSPREHQELFGL